jgi:deferrochelatase/peroxidase EfeB
MSSQALVTPLPTYEGVHQAGIADPVWPAAAPAGVDANTYAKSYAGDVERQRHLHIVFADALTDRKAELKSALEALSGFARHQMLKEPPPLRPLDPPPANRRVTVTIGLGAPIFLTRHGDDRFGFAALRPRGLKIMPQFVGDDGFDPADQATDLVLLIASDDYYVNEYILGRVLYGTVSPLVVVRRVERGYARPDSREPSGFEDGITNPKNLADDRRLDRFVFVRRGDPEPDWCADGTYMAYRKVRRRLKAFFQLDVPKREDIFGTDTKSGERRKRNPHDSHAPKMNPRRKEPDFTGTPDDSRHFFRRPYFFDDGLDPEGNEVRGLHHVSFVRNVITQYEWPILLWQTNKDFPVKDSGIDALYARGGAANIGGGYYFMPAAAWTDGDFVGAGLFA